MDKSEAVRPVAQACEPFGLVMAEPLVACGLPDLVPCAACGRDHPDILHAAGAESSTRRGLFMARRDMTTTGDVPKVGVGCIVVRDGRVLLVRNNSGYWSTPGGYLEFGESPVACAVRETEEEAGIRVSNLEFVAITNDIMEERGTHFVTIWMRGEPEDGDLVINDTREIREVGWFDLTWLPEPRHVYFDNLISARCLPPYPLNSPFAPEC